MDREYWEKHLADESHLDSQAEWLRHTRNRYADWVRLYLSGGHRVLKTDAFEEMRGAELIDALSALYCHIVVGDLAFPALQRAAKSTGTPGRAWVQTAVQTQPFADNSFDAVASFSTLDHFRTPVEIGDSLRDLARITKPGGQLLITLDNGANPLIAARNWLPHPLLAATGLAPYTYGCTLGPDAFKKELGSSGWAVQHYTTVIHEPRALAVAAAPFCHQDGQLTRERYQAQLRRFDHLESLPTKWLTGYFLLALAVRRA